jgi:hypothetical protein
MVRLSVSRGNAACSKPTPRYIFSYFRGKNAYLLISYMILGTIKKIRMAAAVMMLAAYFSGYALGAVLGFMVIGWTIWMSIEYLENLALTAEKEAIDELRRNKNVFKSSLPKDGAGGKAKP